MNTEVWNLESSNGSQIYEAAARYVKSGRLVAFPTETVYGIGALADDSATIEKIYNLKDRPKSKLFAWHLSAVSEIEKLKIEASDLFYEIVNEFAPGPFTGIVRGSDGETVGIRVPSHPVCQKFIAACGGAILATSANPSGKPSPTSGEMVREYFEGRIDLILDAGMTGLEGDSTVIDFTQEPFKIIRPGVYSGLLDKLKGLDQA